jgi:hypothetical protein
MLAADRASHKELPSNHSPLFAPVYEPALKTGIAAEVSVLRDLLKGSAADVAKETEKPSGN